MQSLVSKASFKPKQPETLAMLGQPSAGPSGHEPENVQVNVSGRSHLKLEGFLMFSGIAGNIEKIHDHRRC